MSDSHSTLRKSSRCRHPTIDCSKKAAVSESKVKFFRNGKVTKALIFVVDDEPMLLELAAVILEPLGYHVKTFRDPQSAVEAYNSARPHPALIITDYAM